MTPKPMPDKTAKFDELLRHYETMARDGLRTQNGGVRKKAFVMQEATVFRDPLKVLFARHAVGSVLDYGAGGTPWSEKVLDSGEDLLSYVGSPAYLRYEPARAVDERQQADAVVCFDVLEHIYIGDVAWVLEDIFRHARKLVVLNVACYPAQALLPNGENAHITQRPPMWWKGAVDMAAAQHPELTVALFASVAHGKVKRFPDICFADLNRTDGYLR